jgi:hypothetical protein
MRAVYYPAQSGGAALRKEWYNRMSAIAFNNMPTYLTCDATKRRNRRYVTSGLQKAQKIAYNYETVRDRA